MEESYNEPKRWRATQKLPLKQVSFGLDQLVKTGIPTHLRRLKKILNDASQLVSPSGKATDDGLWDCRSQLRLVLALLAQDLREVENMRAVVKDEDSDRFSHIAGPICHKVHLAIQDAKQVIAALDKRQSQLSSPACSPLSPTFSSGFVDGQGDDDTDNENFQWAAEQEQCLLDNEFIREKEQQVDALARDMADLQDMMQLLQASVIENGVAIEAIEAHVEAATVNVSAGEKFLRQARYLKTAAFPVVGATVGLIAGGPIGAVAGVRVGIVASFVGSAIGYAGGKLIHKANGIMPPVFRPKDIR